MKYYVSSLERAKSDGLSPETPLRKLKEVESLPLKSGDELLFERGSVFKGESLQLRNLGEKGEAPILISAYGEGERPRIEAEGKGLWYQDYGCELDNPNHVYKGVVSTSLLLEDCVSVRIEELEITNSFPDADYSDPNKRDRTGIAVVAKERDVSSITLFNVYVHDVNGNVYDKHMANGGVTFTVSKSTKGNMAAIFEDILLDSLIVENVSRWGIALGYTFNHHSFSGAQIKPDASFHRGIEIRNCLVIGSGGDGITVFYADKPIVHNNEVYFAASEMNDRIYTSPGKRMGKVAAAIWPWKCRDALFTGNIAAGTRLNQDGMAYDADSGNGTIYEHNLSWGNDGGAVMFCLEEAVNSTYRENISFDDLGGSISPAGCPDALIIDNVFYKRASVPFLRERMSDGIFKAEENTIITVEEGAMPDVAVEGFMHE